MCSYKKPECVLDHGTLNTYCWLLHGNADKLSVVSYLGCLLMSEGKDGGATSLLRKLHLQHLTDFGEPYTSLRLYTACLRQGTT